jgi:hypothetical protein
MTAPRLAAEQFIIISMVLMIVFYRYYSSFPCWIYAQGYALYKRFLADQHLIVYLYYQIIFVSWLTIS